MKETNKKKVVFIDGANLYATAKTLGIEVDYKVMAEYLSPLRFLYFTAIKEDEEFSSIRPLLDWLDYNGYNVVSKYCKTYTDADGRTKIKGNMDIEIAVHMMELADKLDEIVLISGDGDFTSLVEAVQRKGCHVTVMSTIKTNPPMIADDLRRQADKFVDFHDIRNLITSNRRKMMA